MDEIVQDFERILAKENEEGVQIVGIVGLGGSGKTTLATEVYNRKSSSINLSSFLHDVRNAASRYVLHTKQKKLLEDFHIETKSFDNVKDGKAIIADRLTDECVLIVLDDVDHEDQLDALLPLKERLGRGSLVIVTTRDEGILTKWDITSIYKVKPLQGLQAVQLFCWHAFLQPFTHQGFEDLVESFLNSCSGLPWSLKVIGGLLFKRSREYWVSQLKKIQRILPDEIMERLKVSYDALDKEEQEIFLDIACFFIGEKRSIAIDIWDASGWSGLCSWEALQNKCLVESYEDVWGKKELFIESYEDVWGKKLFIRMHDHLRDLGRQIPKTHSPQRIRIEGSPFRGLADSEDRRVKFEPGHWGEAIESAELLRGVLWLEWRGSNYRHRNYTSIPTWLPLDTIIVLEFHRAGWLETLWKDARPPLQLRELRIVDAPRLQSLPRSIGRLHHLKRLSIDGLRCLSSLPEEFCQLKLLEHLVLRGCDALSDLPDHFGDLVNLRHLDLRGCKRLKRLPESFKQLINLKYLDLDGCVSLESRENIPNLKAVYFGNHTSGDHTSVGQLSLSFSSGYIGRLLPIICQLSELKELQIEDEVEIEGFKLQSLPRSICRLQQYLKRLSIDGLRCLSSLPEELCELQLLEHLVLEGCDALSGPPDRFGDLGNLRHLDCPPLQLNELRIVDAPRLQSLPRSIGRLQHLKRLSIDG